MTTFDLADDRFKSITLGPDGAPVAATVVLKGERTPDYLAAIQAVEDGTAPGPPGPPAMHVLDAVWNDALGMDPSADFFRQMVKTGYQEGMTLETVLRTAYAEFAPYLPGRSFEQLCAQIMEESSGDQDQLGDFAVVGGDPAAAGEVTPELIAYLEGLQPPVSRNSNGDIARSYGLGQVKLAEYHPGVWDYIRRDPLFCVRYMLAYQAVGVQGKMTWLRTSPASPYYKAYADKMVKGGYTPIVTEVWAGVGEWFSGEWRDTYSNQYVTRVKGRLAAKEWVPMFQARLDPWGVAVGAAPGAPRAALKLPAPRGPRPVWKAPVAA